MLKRLLVTTAIVAVASSAYAADNANQNKTGAMNPPAINYVSTTNVTAGDLLASKLIGQAVYSGAPAGAMTTAPNAMAPAAKTDTQAQNDQMKKGQAQDNTSMAANGQVKNGQATTTAQGQNTTVVAQNKQEHIGDINDLVVAKDGSIDAVIIGVGGFLGMGEKNVAVAYDSLQWSTDDSGKSVAYLDATKDQLQNAPSFDTSKMQQNANVATNAPANGQAPAANADQNANGTVAMNAPANGTDQNAAMGNPNSGSAVDATKISANDLMNTTVYDTDNQNVGDVGDVIVTKDGKIDAVIVDVGGFLGIGQKPVAIAFDDLNIRKDQNGNLTAYTTFSKDQLDNAPKYDKDAYQTQRDTMRLHTQG